MTMRHALFLCLSLVIAAPAMAATVVGSIQDSFGLPYSGQYKTIQFTPLSAPQAIGTNTIWPVEVSKKFTNTFSVNLVGGLYWAGLIGDDETTGGPKKTVKVLVDPAATNVLQFNDCATMATNLGTFSYTNFYYNYVGDGAGITNIQASNVVGIVTSSGGITNGQAGVTLPGFMAATLEPDGFSTNITFKNFWIMDAFGYGTETGFLQQTNGILNIMPDTGVHVLGTLFSEDFHGNGASLTNLSLTATTQNLFSWVAAEAYQPLVISNDANGIVRTATVQWPDGSAGVLTTTETNATWLTVDGFTLTHAGTGRTITQPAVTREPVYGIVTNKPALTIQ